MDFIRTGAKQIERLLRDHGYGEEFCQPQLKAVLEVQYIKNRPPARYCVMVMHHDIEALYVLHAGFVHHGKVCNLNVDGPCGAEMCVECIVEECTLISGRLHMMRMTTRSGSSQLGLLAESVE